MKSSFRLSLLASVMTLTAFSVAAGKNATGPLGDGYYHHAFTETENDDWDPSWADTYIIYSKGSRVCVVSQTNAGYFVNDLGSSDFSGRKGNLLKKGLKPEGPQKLGTYADPEVSACLKGKGKFGKSHGEHAEFSEVQKRE